MDAKELYIADDASSRHLSNLLSASSSICEAADYSTLLTVLLTIITEQTSAKRIFLLKPQDDSFTLEARSHSTSKGLIIEFTDCEINWDDLSKELINKTIYTKKLQYSKVSKLSAAYASSPYLQGLSGFNTLSLPAVKQERLVAIFYLELRENDEPLSNESLSGLGILANHAAAAIEAATLQRGIDEVNQLRLKLERALRLADTSLASGEHISRTGSWRWDQHKNTLVCSEEFCHIFDLDPQQRNISFADFVACIHPDDKKSVLDRIHFSVQMETAINVEYRIVKADGSVLYLTGQGCPVFDTNKLVDYVGIVNDVTTRRASENALRSAKDELVRASRITTIGQLTSSIAHEINQPLMSIVANAGAALRWLNRPVPDLPQVNASLQSIATEGHRAGQIVKSLRMLTKNTKASLSVMDIHDALKCILTIARSEIERLNVLLELNLDAKFSNVRGDMVQLQQVMLNLIMNAIEAMNEISNRARVLTISTFTKKDQVIVVKVEDSGPGISDEVKDRLFDAFYTTKKDGMGMGLTICHSIVEMHGGELSATQRQPLGSVFSFSIPLVKD